MLINIPIENLDIRYSTQWNTWFPEGFKKFGIEFFTVYPSGILTDTIENGSFLDVCGSNYFKSLQLQELVKLLYFKKIKDGDVLFFHDLWYPGLEMLAYIRDGLGVDFKITGCLHAGTWDTFDFLSKKGMASWASSLENSWFAFVDKIFVATNFHRDLILSCREIDTSKICVTGFPIYQPFISDVVKEDIVVFPHRLDVEKNPMLFDKLSMELENSCRFIKTYPEYCEKTKYYELLSKSKVAISFADQETWGIAQQEALFCNNFPVVPNRLSYVQMYFDMFRYDSYEEAKNMVLKFLNEGEKSCYRNALLENKNMLLKKGSESIGKIIEEVVKFC